ncbi:cbb3-type cytochrome oxidase subunit 3 [Gemmatimonas sp.]|uniref:cbb3-type cytochrome oxidase subunit 3 n=1 Tax=Gemmatimonas sp. TaxID=1962908 RepID=UPI0037C136A4
MKLSDIMSYADLSNYAEIALVLFLGVFIAITIRTFLPSRRRELYEASLLPLEEDRVITPRAQER